MTTNRNSKGFAVLELLLIIIVVGLIGFTGWYVYNSRQEADRNYGTTAVNKSAASKKSYSDAVGKFSVKYPSNWKLVAATDNADDSQPTTDAKLTSPSGSVLILRSDWGGRGGNCEPGPNDQPFQAGNACATKEYLSSEKVSVGDVYYGQDAVDAQGMVSYSYRKTDVVMVTSRYAGPDGKSQYSVGLTQSNPESKVELNKPEMGFVVPQHFITVYDKAGKMQPYVYAYATSDDPDFLKGNDAGSIKEILRSLKLN